MRPFFFYIWFGSASAGGRFSGVVSVCGMTGMQRGGLSSGAAGRLLLADLVTMDFEDAAEIVNPGGRVRVRYDTQDPEIGIVSLIDAGGAVTEVIRVPEISTVVVPCFTPGTLIVTQDGEVPVETIKAGDQVITRDNGIQTVRWAGRRELDARDLVRARHLCPILIRAGALGAGLPERDMQVSPNHRFLIVNDRSVQGQQEPELLVAAKHLTGRDGVETVSAEGVTYIHFMFDRHEIVLADGAWTESFQPGDLTLAGVGRAQRREIFEIFPDLRSADGIDAYGPARTTMRRHDALALAP